MKYDNYGPTTKKRYRKSTSIQPQIWSVVSFSRRKESMAHSKPGLLNLFGECVQRWDQYRYIIEIFTKNTVHILFLLYLRNFHPQIFPQWTDMRLYTINTNIYTTKDLSDMSICKIYIGINIFSDVT